MNRTLLTCSLVCALLFAQWPAASQSKPTGAPVPEDSALFASFKLLEQQPAYRTAFTMQLNDPRMAQAAAHGFSMGAMETIVKGGVHQATTRMKFPAFDKPGGIDDWEILAVVKDGRGARVFKSDAIPRLQKMNDQMLAMQLAMMEKQAAMTMARAAAQGPYGAIEAAMTGVETAASAAMMIREEKKANEMWGWKCLDKVGATENADHSTNPFTDLNPVGDDTINGVAVTGYEFYVREKGEIRGPMRLFVNKSTGLPLRIDMKDPQMPGGLHLDYSYDNIPDIEMPPCMTK